MFPNLSSIGDDTEAAAKDWTGPTNPGGPPGPRTSPRKQGPADGQRPTDQQPPPPRPMPLHANEAQQAHAQKVYGGRERGALLQAITLSTNPDTHPEMVSVNGLKQVARAKAREMANAVQEMANDGLQVGAYAYKAFGTLFGLATQHWVSIFVNTLHTIAARSIEYVAMVNDALEWKNSGFTKPRGERTYNPHQRPTPGGITIVSTSPGKEVDDFSDSDTD